MHRQAGGSHRSCRPSPAPPPRRPERVARRRPHLFLPDGQLPAPLRGRSSPLAVCAPVHCARHPSVRASARTWSGSGTESSLGTCGPRSVAGACSAEGPSRNAVLCCAAVYGYRCAPVPPCRGTGFLLPHRLRRQEVCCACTRCTSCGGRLGCRCSAASASGCAGLGCAGAPLLCKCSSAVQVLCCAEALPIGAWQHLLRMAVRLSGVPAAREVRLSPLAHRHDEGPHRLR